MRIPALSAMLCLTIVDLGLGQTVDMKSPTSSPALPQYRPALLGSGPDSLINRIDTADLMKKGQKDAAIMFASSIKKTGEVAWSSTYRGTPDSKLLEQEVQKRLAPAANTKFIPAIYDYSPVEAIYYGTVTFAIVKDKPRLRIFANQETAEVAKESDFVGPQPFFGGDSGFTGVHYPPKKSAPVQVDGAAEIDLTIDENGNVQRIELRDEEPPFLGFGEAAVKDFSQAKFIPAFRAGKPTACKVTLPVYFKGSLFTQ